MLKIGLSTLPLLTRDGTTRIGGMKRWQTLNTSEYVTALRENIFILKTDFWKLAPLVYQHGGTHVDFVFTVSILKNDSRGLCSFLIQTA